MLLYFLRLIFVTVVYVYLFFVSQELNNRSCAKLNDDSLDPIKKALHPVDCDTKMAMTPTRLATGRVATVGSSYMFLHVHVHVDRITMSPAY